MDRSDVIKLIKREYTVDAIGQRIAQETSTEVFCNITSVSLSEWDTAGRAGLKAEFRATMFDADYSGETVAEYDGVRYGIYRTYRTRNDSIELYLERQAGV